ncbi:MAG: AEC family transporter [Clostridia bacterium]|nr:AEC family transporter [Clostridia bacterium]
MFIIMAVGFICGKMKLITPEVNRGLSNLALMVVNPLTTFTSYQTTYSNEIAVNLLFTFVLAIVAFAVQIPISMLIIKKSRKEYRIERLSILLSNCSYIGIPLVQSMYGNEGIIYLTAFVTVFHLVTWTYGLSLMSGETDVKKMLRNMISPVLVAVLLGAFCFFVRLRIPEIIVAPMKRIADMNTPVAMLIAGSTLSQTDIKKAVTKVSTFVICALKLIVLPICVLVVVSNAQRLGVPSNIINIVVIAASCPTATIITMFSHRFKKNSVYASEIFTICTLLSVITIPFVLYLGTLLGL